MTQPTAGDASRHDNRLAEFLSRYRFAGAALSRSQAHAAADRISGLARAGDAELSARGYQLLTIAHGDPETREEQDALRQVHAWGEQHPGAMAGTRGGNDSTTWILTGADAAGHLAALQAIAQEHNLGWWRIRQAGR